MFYSLKDTAKHYFFGMFTVDLLTILSPLAIPIISSLEIEDPVDRTEKAYQARVQAALTFF